MIAPLPITITYTTEAELRQLENLRMRVALLLQEIYLEQVKIVLFSPLYKDIRHFVMLIYQTAYVFRRIVVNKK